MAPSLLLQPESPPQSYSYPLRPASKHEGAVSHEAHVSVDGSGSSSLASDNTNNGQVNGSHTFSNGTGHRGQCGRDNDFVTSQSLLQQSQMYASQNQAPNGASTKPNILYIMADQMAAPLLKINDPNSVIKTPHLDELARTGVNFASAYCNSPLCAPSRFTMCTGQLPSKIGGYDNASILGPEVPTYAHYLRREGYETALAGKMHFIGPDQLHGFEHRYAICSIITNKADMCHQGLPPTSTLEILDGPSNGTSPRSVKSGTTICLLSCRQGHVSDRTNWTTTKMSCTR
jgi:hypothetical protein